jgi:hypothetical protein
MSKNKDTPPPRVLALFAEWEADYVAARERDAKALFEDAPIRSSEPPQAANDNQRDRGGRE